MKFNDDKITEVAVQSGDRSLFRVQVLVEEYQHEGEAKDSWAVRERKEKYHDENEAKDSWTIREKEEHWYAGACPTTASDVNTQIKLHELHKRRLQRWLPLKDVCIKKMKIVKRSKLTYEDDLTNKNSELDTTGEEDRMNEKSELDTTGEDDRMSKKLELDMTGENDRMSKKSESAGEDDRLNKQLELDTKSCNAGTDVVHFARMSTGCVSLEVQFDGDVNFAQVEPTFRLVTLFRDKPRVKHMSTHDHATHELSTHIEHPLRRSQYDKTLMAQRSDIDETGWIKGIAKAEREQSS